MSRLREEHDVRAPSVAGLHPKHQWVRRGEPWRRSSFGTEGDIYAREACSLRASSASTACPASQAPVHVHPSPDHVGGGGGNGGGGTGGLAVGAVVVPAMEETGALPRTPSGPYGRSCLRHDRSSSNLPVAPLWSARLCPQPPLHLYACEECRGVDVWEVGHAVSPRVRPACPHAQRS
jgi:hypothetical protein